MNEIAENLLKVKASLDHEAPGHGFADRLILRRLFAKGYLSPGWNDRSPEKAVIVNGEAFALASLPFCDPYFDTKLASVEAVPPQSVLGGAYSSVPALDSQAATELADTLDFHSKENQREAALYVKVGPFPLYVPVEGKHRVSLYRSLGRNIIARVYTSSYPAPEELELVPLKPAGTVGLRYLGSSEKVVRRRTEWQSVSVGGDRLAILPFKESVDLLVDYGVRWAKPQLSVLSRITRRQVELYVARRFYIR